MASSTWPMPPRICLAEKTFHFSLHRDHWILHDLRHWLTKLPYSAVTFFPLLLLETITVPETSWTCGQKNLFWPQNFFLFFFLKFMWDSWWDIETNDMYPVRCSHQLIMVQNVTTLILDTQLFCPDDCRDTMKQYPEVLYASDSTVTGSERGRRVKTACRFSSLLSCVFSRFSWKPRWNWNAWDIQCTNSRKMFTVYFTCVSQMLLGMLQINNFCPFH